MVINKLNTTFAGDSKFLCLKPIVIPVKKVIVLTKSCCFGTLCYSATIIKFNRFFY